MDVDGHLGTGLALRDVNGAAANVRPPHPHRAAAQTSSIILALLTGGVVWLVFFLAARNEEDILASIHGEKYRNYMSTVPRFVPRLSLWRDVEMVQTRPFDTVKTFFDSSLLLLAIPVFALIEYFQSKECCRSFSRFIDWPSSLESSNAGSNFRSSR